MEKLPIFTDVSSSTFIRLTDQPNEVRVKADYDNGKD